MNKAALDYKLYQFMLEGNITSLQRQQLVEVGFLDKVKSWLGGGVDVGKSLGKAIADKAHQRQFDSAKNDITKGVEELKGVAQKAGISDGDVALFLKGVLDGAGAPAAAEIANAKPNNDAGTDEGKAGGSGIKPGTPIDPSKQEEAVPTIAAAAAEASGQDAEKAKEQASEKKVDVPKASKVLAAAVAKQAKADPGLATKVIDWLLQNKHMQAEGGGRPTAADILRAVQSSLRSKRTQSERPVVLVERWQKLAGLLREESEKADPRVEKAKKKFGDFLEDLQKSLGIKDEEAESLMNVLITLDELESIQIK